jgi:CheY-like chemotaxis protein
MDTTPDLPPIALSLSQPARRILIVDDDATAARVTQRGLQARLGVAVEVEVAPSPAAAWLRCTDGHIDLLIVDPPPHDRRPTTLLNAVRAEHPHILVMVLTAYDTPRLRAEVAALGMRHYFAKPVELVHLEQGVRRALGLDAATS